MVYFITWGMHVFSHQFPIIWERQPNPSNGESLWNWFAVIFYKTHCMWRTSEIGTHTFLIVWLPFFIIFPSYGMLHRMENARFLSSNSHSIRKFSETGSHTFSIKWVVFSIRFSSCGILHHLRKASRLSSISHSMGKGRKTHHPFPEKILQNPSYRENLGNCYS